MSTRRKVEILSAGCRACHETIDLVKGIIACPSCDVTVLDMKDAVVANRAKSLGVQSVPAVVIDGKLSPTVAAVEASLRPLCGLRG